MNLRDWMSNVKKTELMGKEKPTTKTFDDWDRFCKEGNPAITQIIVRKGAIVDNVSFVCGNTVFGHGGNGGTEYRHNLDKGEAIVKVEGSYAKFKGQYRIADIAFVTNKGRKLTFGAANTGEGQFAHASKEGYTLCCMFGNSEAYVDHLGFYEVNISQIQNIVGGK